MIVAIFRQLFIDVVTLIALQKCCLFLYYYFYYTTLMEKLQNLSINFVP